MCIRDSLTRQVLRDQLGAQMAAHRLTLIKGLPGTGKTVLPVSYTHLRAHETVLDLVCRLLLEKKKTT